MAARKEPVGPNRKTNHGYDTTLYGLPHGVNWIFFQFDDDSARFVHIVPSRRNKSAIRF